MRTAGSFSIWGAALLLAVGCGGPATLPGVSDAPETPQDIAVSLFSLPDDPEPAVLEALFGQAYEGTDLADLLDALDALPRGLPVVVTGTEGGGFDQSIAVDLDLGSPESGVDRYSVTVVPAGESWQVAWFQGPDLGWPPHRAPQDGTSSSAPPEADSPSPKRTR